MVWFCALPFSASETSAQMYELVLINGRVMDPESGLDAIRPIGITGGAIQAISETQLEGRDTVDATGRVVASGFIEVSTFDHGDHFFRLRAADGVTAVLAVEGGGTEVAACHNSLEGRALLHHGTAASVTIARRLAVGDTTLVIMDGAEWSYTPCGSNEVMLRGAGARRAG